MNPSKTDDLKKQKTKQNKKIIALLPTPFEILCISTIEMLYLLSYC